MEEKSLVVGCKALVGLVSLNIFICGWDKEMAGS